MVLGARVKLVGADEPDRGQAVRVADQSVAKRKRRSLESAGGRDPPGNSRKAVSVRPSVAAGAQVGRHLVHLYARLPLELGGRLIVQRRVRVRRAALGDGRRGQVVEGAVQCVDSRRVGWRLLVQKRQLMSIRGGRRWCWELGNFADRGGLRGRLLAEERDVLDGLQLGRVAQKPAGEGKVSFEASARPH